MASNERSCDAHLYRVMCYLYHTQESMLAGWIGDPSEELYVEMFVDADFCGDDEGCYSTSGGWIQLSGQNTVSTGMAVKETEYCCSFNHRG